MFRLSGTFPFNEDEEIEDVRVTRFAHLPLGVFSSKFAMPISCFHRIRGKRSPKKVRGTLISTHDTHPVLATDLISNDLLQVNTGHRLAAANALRHAFFEVNPPNAAFALVHPSHV